MLNEAKRPLVILGSAMFERSDATSIYANATQLSEKLRDIAIKEYKEWRVFNVLHRVNLNLKNNKKITKLNLNDNYSSMHLKWLLSILDTSQTSK